MDVVELYRNIPDDEGLSAVKKKTTGKPQKYVTMVTIIDLAEEVLKVTDLHSGERHTSENGGLPWVPNFHLFIALYLWQNSKR